MKKISLLIILLITLVSTVQAKNPRYLFTQNNDHEKTWAIVGAGPAGITVVGLLLDLGVSPNDIFWIDPEFAVGRIGKYYENVPANTKTKLFISFLESCKTFAAVQSPSIAALSSYDLEKEYPLSIIIDPLKDITEHLKHTVHALQGSLRSLDFTDNHWNVSVQTAEENQRFQVGHVVLATGSHPRTLDYDCKETIPLDIALDKPSLAQIVTEHDSVAVVGSSHSAILLLKFLSEIKVKRIINFYKNPLLYAIDMGTWLLHNANGLKGETAQWAQEVLEKNPPANLIRLYNSPEARDAWLPVCNKIIYAIGYEQNQLPIINGGQSVTYDDHSGVIAPRLFGIGIAFPEAHTDPLGNKEHRVGLNSFMDYAQRVVPQWLTKDVRARLSDFEQLFMIEIL